MFSVFLMTVSLGQHHLACVFLNLFVLLEHLFRSVDFVRSGLLAAVLLERGLLIYIGFRLYIAVILGCFPSVAWV